jgi:hypothetical protein
MFFVIICGVFLFLGLLAFIAHSLWGQAGVVRLWATLGFVFGLWLWPSPTIFLLLGFLAGLIYKSFTTFLRAERLEKQLGNPGAAMVLREETFEERLERNRTHALFLERLPNWLRPRLEKAKGIVIGILIVGGIVGFVVWDEWGRKERLGFRWDIVNDEIIVSSWNSDSKTWSEKKVIHGGCRYGESHWDANVDSFCRGLAQQERERALLSR